MDGKMQKEFNKILLLMAADALAAYPNHNNCFDIYTDVSDFSWGLHHSRWPNRRLFQNKAK